MEQTLEHIKQPLVLFDGVCNLCNTFVRFLLKYNSERNLYFASLQGEIAKKIFICYPKINKLESVIFIENGRIYSKSEAIFAILSHLRKFRWLKFLNVFPLVFLNWAYDLIAKNRYAIFGKKDFCMLPNEDISNRFLE